MVNIKEGLKNFSYVRLSRKIINIHQAINGIYQFIPVAFDEPYFSVANLSVFTVLLDFK